MTTDIRRRIRGHVARLGDEDREVGIRAEECLIRYYGARALDELIAACDHPNPAVRFRAVWALGYTRDPRAYETILRLTDDPDELVRYDATLALGVLGDPRALEPLLRLWFLLDETRPAADAVGRMGIESRPTLEAALRHQNPRVRESAVSCLGRLAVNFDDLASVDLLRRCLDDPADGVRSGADDALREWETKNL